MSFASPSNRLRFAELVQAALFDTVGEGLLLTTSGRVDALNRIGAELLSVDRQMAIGARVEALWPCLARMLEGEAGVADEPLTIDNKRLLFTVRYVGEAQQRLAVVRIVEALPLERRVESVAKSADLAGMIGESAGIVAVRKLAQIAAQSNSSVLVEGESGAGKEVVAQAIHSLGPRKSAPFVAVHCAAIPADLLESELFGHDAGAFTGANRRGSPGKFEVAEGGTLLLDDVADLPLHMQAKLLRVLQEKTVVRLGSSRSRRVDVHVVATSNQTLRAAVDAGRFRADLFYRLNVLHIVIPPLRERPEDIGLLAEHFLRKYAQAHGRALQTLGPEALRALHAYSWPGNIRELEHWIESEIHFAPPRATRLERLTRAPTVSDASRPTPAIVRPLRDVEREVIVSALSAAGDDVSCAARELGISRGKLYRKLRQYGLDDASRDS
ncbi:MAG TPA: sigma 54-interacting transcriptional regulator [Myxococcales bacterium]